MALFCGWELYMTTLYDENYIWQLFREFYMRTWNSRRPILCWLLLYLPLSFIWEIWELYMRTMLENFEFQEALIVLVVALLASFLTSPPFLWPSKTFKVMIINDTIHNDIIALPSCDLQKGLQGIWASMTLRMISSNLFSTSWCCRFMWGDQIIVLNFLKGSASWWWST